MTLARRRIRCYLFFRYYLRYECHLPARARNKMMMPLLCFNNPLRDEIYNVFKASLSYMHVDVMLRPSIFRVAWNACDVLFCSSPLHLIFHSAMRKNLAKAKDFYGSIIKQEERRERESFYHFLCQWKISEQDAAKHQKLKFRKLSFRLSCAVADSINWKCFKFPFKNPIKFAFSSHISLFLKRVFPRPLLFLSCQHLLLERMFRRIVDEESFSMMFEKEGI